MLQCVEIQKCVDDPANAEMIITTKDGDRVSYILSKSAASSLVKSIHRLEVKEHSYLSKIYDEKGAEIKDGKLIYYEIYSYPTRKTRMKKTIKLENVKSRLPDLPKNIVEMIAGLEDEEWKFISDKAKSILSGVKEVSPEDIIAPVESVKQDKKNVVDKLSKLLMKSDKRFETNQTVGICFAKEDEFDESEYSGDKNKELLKNIRKENVDTLEQIIIE